MRSRTSRSAGLLLLSIVALAYAVPLELELAHIHDVIQVQGTPNSPEGTLHPALAPRRTSETESAIVANAAAHIVSVPPHDGLDEDSPSRTPSIAVSGANSRLGGVLNPTAHQDEHVSPRPANGSPFFSPPERAPSRASTSDTTRTDAYNRTTPVHPPLRTSWTWWHGAETAAFVALVLLCGAVIGWICENFRIDL